MPAWVDGVVYGATAPITAHGQQSQANDSARTELTPSSREAIRAQAQKLLDNPRGLSPEVIAWANRWK